MSRDNDLPESGDAAGFVGEEEVSEPVTAKQNLIAAIVIAAIAILAMILAVRLEIPGRLVAAPGLLPFVVGFSLLLMAVALGVLAVRDGGARNLFGGFGGAGEWLRDEERRRTVLLLGIIVAYVVLVDMVPFEWRLPLGIFELRFSGYELFSIAALALILRIFWRRPIFPHCLGVSFAMAMALAAVFRYGFRLLLPGLG
jgi:hypothetical protein